MTKDDLTTRIEALESRQRQLEDELAIYRLIAAYGPAVDTINAEATAALWQDDGSYDFGGPVLQGAEAVGQLVNLDTHRDFIARGCAHVLSLPLVSVSGDAATAVCYSQVFVAESDGWRAARVSANHLTLARGSQGWRVVTRETRLLDGAEAARALLARGVGAGAGR
jgi:hypothetical protein